MGIFLKKIYERDTVRFLVVGGLNTVLTYAVYLLGLLFVDYRVSYIIAFIVGLVFTTVMNIHHTFSSRLTLARSAIYGSYYFLYSGANILLLQYLVDGLGVDEKWAPLIMLFIMIPIHYILSKLLVQAFNRRDRQAVTDE